jgi:hypothetical protein
VFHVELRQFPHQARAFNLTRSELDARILGPWASGTEVELDDRRFSPERTRLTIYEGPELSEDQRGLGRGWANVTRQGEDVTARLLAEVAQPTAVAEFKRALLAGCAQKPVALGRVVELAGERYPQARVSERIALAEHAVWELLHEGAVVLARGEVTVAREEWQGVLLGWAAWSGGEVTVRIAGS